MAQPATAIAVSFAFGYSTLCIVCESFMDSIPGKVRCSIRGAYYPASPTPLRLGYLSPPFLCGQAFPKRIGYGKEGVAAVSAVIFLTVFFCEMRQAS